MGVIYKKTCSETGQVYYGKFEKTWDERFSSGWSDCRCEYFVNPTVVFIEIDIPNDKLKEREDYYIQNFECVNLKGKYIHLSKAEWSKQYRIKNKDIIIKKSKQYYIDNKEIRNQYDKQYRIDNKEILAKRQKQKIKCNNCGSTIVKRQLKRHQTTNKCMNFIV